MLQNYKGHFELTEKCNGPCFQSMIAVKKIFNLKKYLKNVRLVTTKNAKSKLNHVLTSADFQINPMQLRKEAHCKSN